MTSLLRTERANINQRPSSYHGVSNNTTDYRSYESSQQRALNRMVQSIVLVMSLGFYYTCNYFIL